MVKRYNFDIPNSSYEEICADGDYVTYDDYEEMSDQYIDLKIKYDRLVSDIGDLWREA